MDCIRGFLGTSLIDYPGHVAGVVFVGKCNLRCRYCYNADLVLRPDARPAIPVGRLVADLERRLGFLDGVVLTGGEPTIYPDLIDLLRTFKAMGLAVKLDTNGSHPAVLRNWLDEGVVQYVAMDIKASPARYSSVAGRPVDVEAISASIDLLRESGCPHEFRTTVVPTLLDVQDVEEIARWIAGPSPFFLQQFRPGGCLDPRLDTVEPYAVSVLEEMAAVARVHLDRVHLRGVTQGQM